MHSSVWQVSKFNKISKLLTSIDRRLFGVVFVLMMVILGSLFTSWKIQTEKIKQNPGTPISAGVTVSDLRDAGYIISTNQNDLPEMGSNMYFRVIEDSSPEVPLTKNIIFVSRFRYLVNAPEKLPFYGVNIRDISIEMVDAQEGQMPDGRISINFINGKDYVVLVGPNAQKLRMLAQIMIKRM